MKRTTLSNRLSGIRIDMGISLNRFMSIRSIEIEKTEITARSTVSDYQDRCWEDRQRIRNGIVQSYCKPGKMNEIESRWKESLEMENAGTV